MRPLEAFIASTGSTAVSGRYYRPQTGTRRRRRVGADRGGTRAVLPASGSTGLVPALLPESATSKPERKMGKSVVGSVLRRYYRPAVVPA